MNRSTKAAIGAVGLATALVAGFEGYVNHVYSDSVGVATYCYGETLNPQPGKTYSRQECDTQLAGRVQQFDTGVRACVHAALPVKVEAAFDSMAYNIGIGAFCGSTLARKANAGDLAGACNEMPKWDRAGGQVLKGLTVRRGAEQGLCLEGVAEGLPK